MIDVTDYKGGARGSRIRVRATIEKVDKSLLIIRDVPYGTTTTALMESIVKASENNKIKIKKVIDNTAANVEIHVQLPPGVSPDLTIDALYAFTDCEVSISPNICVIIEDKPHFLTADDVLQNFYPENGSLIKTRTGNTESRTGPEMAHVVAGENIY